MLVSESPDAERESYLQATARGAHAMDETFGTDGALQPHWAAVIERFESFTPDEVSRVVQSTRRLVDENGITYNIHGAPQDTKRRWELDPVPLVFSSTDWAAIESGLQQRAELLNLILKDLYGPRRLIEEGLLPTELIYRHEGFLRSCDQVLLPGDYELLLYHTDLARGPDGRMWVINDRTQAPSGSGYALENRVVSSHVLPKLFRDCRVRRAANFFRSLESMLRSLAPHGKEDPRIVILTPGPFNETYFEHAYLAAYLGFTLVQGEDLTVRDGKVWLRSLAGLEPVDIILRRCDASFCDPLELRADSRLGVPGLLQAIRQGNVVVANPLGSGVLENPGLMAFLPGIARHLLGEELALPSAATWWCGQESERQYVLDHLETLVVKSINRDPDFGTVFCDAMSQQDLARLRDRIVEQPALFVGQERVSFSTVPCLIDGRLQPRHAVLRGILAASASSEGPRYVVMPGGLTRSARDTGTMKVSSITGGISKDTWVLGGSPQHFVSLWQRPTGTQPHALAADERNLPSRSGENLFWVGRYAERVEGTARLLRRILERYIDMYSTQEDSELAELRILIAALHRVTGTDALGSSSQTDQPLEGSFPEDELISMLTDATRVGSVSSTLTAFMNACYAVRDLWSPDSWRVIESIRSWWESDGQAGAMTELFGFPERLNRLITQLVALTGLNLESMTRQAGWILLDSGRRIERSQVTISLLQSMLVEPKGDGLDEPTMGSLLAASSSTVSHQRKFYRQPRPATILNLLLKDRDYPRSVYYQVSRMHSHFPGLPRYKRVGGKHPVALALERARSALEECDENVLAMADRESGTRAALSDLLGLVSDVLVELSDVLTRSYFDHAGVSTALRG